MTYYMIYFFIVGILVGYSIRPVYWLFTGRDIPMLKKREWTDEDMIEAHNQGWNSAYYKNARQHQKSNEWLQVYKEMKNGSNEEH